MTRQETIRLSIDDVQPGAICSHPVLDDKGILLIGESTQITTSVLDGLRDRGIEFIEIDPRDENQLRGRKANQRATGTHVPKKRDSGSLRQSSDPVKAMLVDRHNECFDVERGHRLTSAFRSARCLLATLDLSGDKVSHEAMQACADVSDAYAQAIVDDCDHTVCSVAVNEANNDLAERSIQLSVMSMAVGVEMGLTGAQIIEIGIAGLLHDLGLLTMDHRFVNLREPMTTADQWEYQKHPLVTTRLLAKLDEFPTSVEMAIEQLHEQFDGTGYPRGLSGRRIHLHARILNVVDTYLQLTKSMMDRPAIVPHDALGYILHQGVHGRFDPKVVRAFLTSETLFPIGSSVELRSGDVAQVIRRPRDGYAHPVLLSVGGDRIELENGANEVVRPVIHPDRQQMRLSLEMMETGLDRNGTPLIAV